MEGWSYSSYSRDQKVQGVQTAGGWLNKTTFLFFCLGGRFFFEQTQSAKFKWRMLKYGGSNGTVLHVRRCCANFRSNMQSQTASLEYCKLDLSRSFLYSLLTPVLLPSCDSFSRTFACRTCILQYTPGDVWQIHHKIFLKYVQSFEKMFNTVQSHLGAKISTKTEQKRVTGKVFNQYCQLLYTTSVQLPHYEGDGKSVPGNRAWCTPDISQDLQSTGSERGRAGSSPVESRRFSPCKNGSKS